VPNPDTLDTGSDSDFTFECDDDDFTVECDDFTFDGNKRKAELDVEPDVSAKRRVIDDEDGFFDNVSDDGIFDFPIDDDSDDDDFFECYPATVHLYTDSDDDEPVEKQTVHEEIASAEKKGQELAAFDALFGPTSRVRRSARKPEPTRVFAMLE
jgi:hypothetical protein